VEGAKVALVETVKTPIQAQVVAMVALDTSGLVVLVITTPEEVVLEQEVQVVQVEVEQPEVQEQPTPEEVVVEEVPVVLVL
jgi:hypothetical protein